MLGVRAPRPRPRQHRALGCHLLAWVGPWVWPWVWRAGSLWEGSFPRWANVCLRGAASAEDARAGLLAGQGRWPGGGARAGRPRARTWQGDRIFQQHVFAREDASRPGFRSAGAGRTQAECPGRRVLLAPCASRPQPRAHVAERPHSPGRLRPSVPGGRTVAPTLHVAHPVPLVIGARESEAPRQLRVTRSAGPGGEGVGPAEPPCVVGRGDRIVAFWETAGHLGFGAKVATC